MKRIATIGLAVFLAVTLAGTVLAAASVNLGTATSFAVLAGTTITNTGSTTITGDVGLHPGDAVTGFADVTHHGTLHIGDAVASGAKDDLVGAYNEAAGATPVTSVPTELGGTTLTPGVYGSAPLGLTGTLTLDGEGVYLFQAGSTLITAPNSCVERINGAAARWLSIWSRLWTSSTTPCAWRRLARTSGEASRKNLKSVSGKMFVPMSRPSMTRLPNWMQSCCAFFIHLRTAALRATNGTAALASAERTSCSGR